MTVTAVGVTAGFVFGPGQTIFCTWPGPTLSDDFVTIQSVDNSISGSIITHGASSGSVMLGYDETSTAFPFYTNSGFLVAPGSTTDFNLYLYHHGGTLVDTGSVTGVVWQPNWGTDIGLLNKIVTGGSMAEILASVKRTYPAT